VPIRLDAPEIEVVQIPAPGAGVEWSFVCPGDGARRIVGGAWTLTTSAVVDNRIATLTVDDQTNDLMRLVGNNVQVAATTQQNSFYCGSIAAFISGTAWTLPFPTDGVLLLPGWRLRSVTRLFDVGDAHSNIALYVVRYPNGPTNRVLPDVPTFLTDKA